MGVAPKLIHINGALGAGKTTIAKMYIADHPLALLASIDDIITYLGGWLTHEEEARDLAFSLVKTMIRTHLATGHDVVVPHLLLDAEDSVVMEEIANECNATYSEFALITDKEEIIQRMYARGTWGEPGSPALTKDDLPIIEEKYDTFMQVLPERPRMIHITSVKGNIEGTYRQLLDILSPQYT
jgi:deoxyadenosine/deoxycytidine kinase